MTHKIKKDKMKALNLNKKKITTGILTVAGLLVAVIVAVAFTVTDESETQAQAALQAMPVEVATPIFEKITEWDE